jgi:hypothetical protein
VIELLTYTIPWWIWLAPLVGVALGVVTVAMRFGGLRNGLMVAAGLGVAVLTVLSHWRGRQKGWHERGQKGLRDAQRFREKADDARRRVRDLPAERLRDDDGFRRKSE